MLVDSRREEEGKGVCEVIQHSCNAGSQSELRSTSRCLPAAHVTLERRAPKRSSCCSTQRRTLAYSNQHGAEVVLALQQQKGVQNRPQLDYQCLDETCIEPAFFCEAREHVGDTFVEGSGLLEQQQAFGSHSKVQQAVQQRLLPDEPVPESERESAAGLYNSRVKVPAVAPGTGVGTLSDKQLTKMKAPHDVWDPSGSPGEDSSFSSSLRNILSQLVQVIFNLVPTTLEESLMVRPYLGLMVYLVTDGNTHFSDWSGIERERWSLQPLMSSNVAARGNSSPPIYSQ
ncbi:hypothetical protein EYF80_021202 [Liparis tanakae]|uniref:Uncharacterized protein n=1 Tax=Liparis tanakae TaxID=230148 RepID=A0A4Z2HRU0_9TELE|nr:hypothetical protein EYF80_021202 [Liparis tanakae]